MQRREFLKLVAIAASSAYTFPSKTPASETAEDPDRQFDKYFLPILQGFLKNARATSPDYVVCDFPNGTKLKSCCTPSGKSFVSVARMLPALVEWQSTFSRRGHAASSAPDAIPQTPNVDEVLLSIYQNAFDPKHPDFWGYGRPDKAVQLNVEASLVALSAFRLKDSVIAKLTSPQRDNLQNWLASTAQFPERKTNHAWFTATNHAARLELSRTYPEFKGDEKWMLEDIKALDGLYATGTDGWYSDAPDQPIYDFYNFYVFPLYPLFWSEIIGQRYPEWDEKFRARLRLFLEKSPYFFDSQGLHPLMGRSLIYRFAVVAPLILAYKAKLWPHSPGMLRRIVRKSLEYHFAIGGYDESQGKLRETYSADGTHDICENYVDNGHPYWAMNAFAFLSIPKSDPLWTAKEEPLPIEKNDFNIRFEGPKMFLNGLKRTGEVRWIQSQNSPKRDYFRDKYIKFAYSSQFPFNILNDKDHIPADQTLLFRRRDNNIAAARAINSVTNAKLLDNGVQMTWFAQLNDWKFDITTTLQLFDGEFELRHHEITAPPETLGRIELAEGSYPLGLTSTAGFDEEANDNRTVIRKKTVKGAAPLIAAWRIRGHDRTTIAQSFDPTERSNINIIHPRVAVIVLSAPLVMGKTRLVSLHYASMKPLPPEEIFTRAAQITSQMQGQKG